jgi:hypothetical protein
VILTRSDALPELAGPDGRAGFDVLYRKGGVLLLKIHD